MVALLLETKEPDASPATARRPHLAGARAGRMARS